MVEVIADLLPTTLPQRIAELRGELTATLGARVSPLETTIERVRSSAEALAAAHRSPRELLVRRPGRVLPSVTRTTP